MRFYSDNHLWLDVSEQGHCLIGLTDRALEHLQEAVAVFFPQSLIESRILSTGDLLAVIESTKSAIDIEAPCPLSDVQVHLALSQDPQRLYGPSGTWLVRGNLDLAVCESLLLTEDAYQRYLGES